MFKISSLLRLFMALFAMVFSFIWFSVEEHFPGAPFYANSLLVAPISILLLFGVNFEIHFFKLMESDYKQLSRPLCLIIIMVAALTMFWYDTFLPNPLVGVYLDTVWFKFSLDEHFNREHTVEVIRLVANLITLVTTVFYLIRLYNLTFERKKK